MNIDECSGYNKNSSTHIPDLKFDRLAIELNGSDFKIDSDGANVALCVGVVCES